MTPKDFWKNRLLNEFGIEWIESQKMLKNLLPDSLLISRCSKTKNILRSGGALPIEFYVSNINKLFYKHCIAGKYRYAILSDLYGIHFDDEYKEFYDIHPSKLNDNDFDRLGKVIRDKTLKKYPNLKRFIFYNTSPKMSIPYFKMLRASGIKTYFISKIDLIDFNRILFKK